MQFHFQIQRTPERYQVEKLSPNGTDEPFHKGMRERKIGRSLYFYGIENSKIDFPPMKFEQRIII
jgi:hypothetical protein